MGNSEENNNNWLRKYVKFLCFCVVLLIFKGALVTSNDAGLSVPDWPTSYGDNMFLFPPAKWIGPIFFEHVHRLIASGVGALTLVLCIWVWLVEKRKWVKILSSFALLAVIMQGILGGLTVLYQLPLAVSSSHAVLAQTFFIMVIILAYSQSKELKQRSAEPQAREKAHRYALAFCAAVYLQLVIGAIMRHSEAGLAVLDFPTTAGQLIPSMNEAMLEQINTSRQSIGLTAVNIFQVAIHSLHRLGALLVILFFIPVSLVVLKKGASDSASAAARRTAKYISVILACQFTLGVVTVLSLRNPWIASLHVMLGAVLLGVSVLLAIRTKRVV